MRIVIRNNINTGSQELLSLMIPYRIHPLQFHKIEILLFLGGRQWTMSSTGSIESVFLAEDLQATSFYKGKWQSRRPRRYGYPVHAYCWSLIERVIGPEVEVHLATFVETLRRRFKKGIVDPSYHTEEDGFFGFDPSQHDEMWSDKTRYLYRDPVRIPELECLLKKKR